MGSENDAENGPAEPKTERSPAEEPIETSDGGDVPELESSKTNTDAGEAEGATPSEEQAILAPRKKKKKKKKRAEVVEAEPPRERGPVYGPDGSERPAFVLGFPDDPELAKVTAAFEAGNYAYVREHATELAERSENAAVKRAATELLTRIEPDPLIRFLLGVSVILLLFLTYYAYANHGH